MAKANYLFVGNVVKKFGRPSKEAEWLVQWGDLATYNAEVARGLVHTSEYKAKMAEKQKRYNECFRKSATT